MRAFAAALALLLALPPLTNCAVQEPAHVHTITLRGSAHERGVQHGKALGWVMRSMYTRLMEASLLPYLSRQQPDIASVLKEYDKEIYRDGRFSYEVLLQSGRELVAAMPEDARQEFEGIVEGSGMERDKLIVFNTFVDTLMALRSVTIFIQQIRAPRMLSLAFLAPAGDAAAPSPLAADGTDNDDDGTTDEADEGRLDPYETSPTAVMTEVPPDARIRVVLKDNDQLAALFGTPEGVDLDSIRVQFGTSVFTAADPALHVEAVMGKNAEGEDVQDHVEVVFTPPGGMQPARVYPMIVQVGDLSRSVKPPPLHAQFMRDERFVFTTTGYGKAAREVENRGESDGRSQPPSIGFVLRGAATTNGDTIMGHHFALLDSNINHEHTVVFHHVPDDGPEYVLESWAGIVWGFSGMNASGLCYAVNESNSLNNPLVKQVVDKLIESLTTNPDALADAKLLLTGTPMGIVGREVLRRATTVEEAIAIVRAHRATYGWNMLLADAAGDVAALEMDGDIREAREPHKLVVMRPGEPDAPGSTSPHDIRMASHFVGNVPDIDWNLISMRIPPQRVWDSFYLRSLRAHYVLGDEIRAKSGHFDMASVRATMRLKDLTDVRDSMTSAIMEPRAKRLHFALGEVPATDAPFRVFDFASGFGPGEEAE